MQRQRRRHRRRQQRQGHRHRPRVVRITRIIIGTMFSSYTPEEDPVAAAALVSWQMDILWEADRIWMCPTIRATAVEQQIVRATDQMHRTYKVS